MFKSKSYYLKALFRLTFINEIFFWFCIFFKLFSLSLLLIGKHFVKYIFWSWIFEIKCFYYHIHVSDSCLHLWAFYNIILANIFFSFLLMTEVLSWVIFIISSWSFLFKTLLIWTYFSCCILKYYVKNNRYADSSWNKTWNQENTTLQNFIQ